MSVKPLFDTFRDYLSLRDAEVLRDCLDRFDWNLSERNLEANSLPIAFRLEGLEDKAGPGERGLVQQFLEYRDRLRWFQSYTADDFGEDFTSNYGFVELIGTRGHFASDEIAAGIVCFGPNTIYPHHWHVAEEFYYPLTNGSLWSMDKGPYEPRKSGEFIHHESNAPHSMKTEDTPLLALFIWRDGDLAQKSDF